MGLASFRLLGPVEVRVEGQLVDIGHARQRAVLAALLVQANKVVPADRLAGYLWEDDPPPTSADLVYGYVSRLRRRLDGAAGLVRVPGGYRLEADPESIDVHRFRRLVAAARSAGDDGHAAALFTSGFGLWRGTALTGVSGRWAEGVRVALEAERAAATLDHGEVRLRLGADADLLCDLREVLAGQPFDERAAGLFMLAAYRSGRRAEALECFHQLRGRLSDEIGVEPGPGLQELFQRLLRDDPVLDEPGGLSQPPGSPVAAVPEVRYSLPPDIAAFTGRDAELSQITAAAGAGAVIAVRAIDGMPGAGKTALAVHAAHLLRQEFPDRQLFINLHAHTPGREPVRPEEALAALLAAVGIDPRFVPADLDGRAAMWRDRMAGQRAVLVLDNAANSGHVAPLLPGSAGCLVLVTSRRHLGDLPGAVAPVLLDVLPPGEAQEMFTRLAPRAADCAGEVAEVAELAGFLPLAISLLARLFARHPSWTLADLAGETRAGLLSLAAEHYSVTAAFDLSYHHLDPARQRLFCLLGLHPGTTTDVYAAAALAATSLSEAAGLLDELHAEGLLTEVGHRRYGMHDLLRRYARDQAPARLGAAESQRALDRLLDYYQHAAALAEARLTRQTRPGPPPAAPVGLLAVPDMGDAGQALAWARADHASLLACLDHATDTGQHALVIALTAGLAGLWRHDGPWADAITRHTAAIRAAQQLGDRLAQANAVADLAGVRRLAGDFRGAIQDLEQALRLYRDLGDRLGQANAVASIGALRRQTADYPGAAAAVEQALRIYNDLGDRLGQANAFRSLGEVRQMTGDYPGVVQAHEKALRLYRDLGDRLGQANSVTNLGIARRLTGNYPGAAAALEEALRLYRDLGDWLGQAIALTYLGSVRRLTGDYPGAAQALEEALSISRDLGDRYGQAAAFTYLGSVRRLTGDYPGGAQALEQALSISRDLGDQSGQAETLNETGTLYRVSGDLARAGQCHQEALDLARAIASPLDEAHALAGLGRCALAVGHPAKAQALLRPAHQIFQQAGDAEAGIVLAELSALTDPRPAG